MSRDYDYPYSFWDYFSIPVPLFFFMFTLLSILGFTWYINYESIFEDFMIQFKLFLMMVPIILLLVVHCMSGWLSYLVPFPEQDSLHRAGGSPWGVACVLMFLLIMISYHSAFQERWFPLISK